MTDNGQVQFIESHTPAVKAGDYTITVEQNVTLKQGDVPYKFTQTRQFSILGPRFTLNPQDVQAVFPPAGNLGDYSNDLPHIILKRSTLPWERSARRDKTTPIPWLALLLFDEGEINEVNEPIRLGDIDKGDAKFPKKCEKGNQVDQELHFEMESGDNDDDLVNIIDVPKKLLEQILPSKDELKLLAHVRQTTDEKGKPQGDDAAFIICNRLPRQGGMSVVHLVSVEGRYGNDGFDFQEVGDDEFIRLVSLYNWRFACVNDQHSFKGLLTHLDKNTLRLPDIADKTANKYFSMGCVPLHHEMRQGNKSVSWYHGPLIPFGDTNKFNLPARSADELVLYDPGIGMFDVSYSAAWELGLLLTLQNKRVSVDLFNWKRNHAQRIKDAKGRLDYLPFSDPKALDLPENVRSWFNNLILLIGLPFNYMVPDEGLLPKESIRFFQVDPLWVECLLDGAFSIGRAITADHEIDPQLKKDAHSPTPGQVLSGFLLRSDLVSGWPGLLVDGYSDREAKNKLIFERMESLSKNVLICIFSGEDAVQAVDVHQKPETIHFGFTSGTDNTIPWRQKEMRVVDISGLDPLKKIENSVDFASRMIESIEKVRFIQKYG